MTNISSRKFQFRMVPILILSTAIALGHPGWGIFSFAILMLYNYVRYIDDKAKYGE